MKIGPFNDKVLPFDARGSGNYDSPCRSNGNQYVPVCFHQAIEDAYVPVIKMKFNDIEVRVLCVYVHISFGIHHCMARWLSG